MPTDKLKPVIVITGCSVGVSKVFYAVKLLLNVNDQKGIGYALAVEWRKRNHRVIATARNLKKTGDLESLGCHVCSILYDQSRLHTNNYPFNIQLVQLDVTEQASVDKAKEEILTLVKAPTPLMLINNAGVVFAHPALE